VAAAGFKIRRVKSELSIGDRLKRARVRKKVSIAQVEGATTIRAKFILALESDSWEQIPSEVYGRGYLERYSTFLQMDSEIMKQYDRERPMYARHCQEQSVSLTPEPKVHIPRLMLTPKLIMAVFLVVAMGGFGAVVYRQISRFSSAPSLELFPVAQAATVADGTELVVTTTSVTISGRTAVGASVEINGQPATVDDNGGFTGTTAVQKGVNAVVITATNGSKQTTETLSVVAKN